MKIKVNDIKPSPFLVRKIEVDEDLRRLADNIKEHGNLVPIKVRPKDGEYECVFGHRRLKAMKLAGMLECEAIVEEIDDNAARIQALIENVQRQDLTPLDEARALHDLQSSLGGISNEKLGAIMGLTKRQVENRLGLLDLPVDIGQEIISTGRRPAEGQLTEKHGRYLRQLRDEPEMQRQVAEKIKREGISGDQTLPLVQALRSAREPTTRKAILETPLVKIPTVRQLIEEAEVGARVERLETSEEAEKERAWWREHPSSKEFLDLLKMYLRLIGRAWESVLKEKIPPEHCNYLAGFIEDKVIGLLQEIVTGLREKAKKWQ
jgi:ParB family chromosome partitioning protein